MRQRYLHLVHQYKLNDQTERKSRTPAHRACTNPHRANILAIAVYNTANTPSSRPSCKYFARLMHAHGSYPVCDWTGHHQDSIACAYTDNDTNTIKRTLRSKLTEKACAPYNHFLPPAQIYKPERSLRKESNTRMCAHVHWAYTHRLHDQPISAAEHGKVPHTHERKRPGSIHRCNAFSAEAYANKPC